MTGKVPKYHVVEGWERLPSDMIHLDVCGVAVDSRDRLFMLGRGDSRVLVYEPDGTFVTSWGEDVFSSRIHGICIGPDDSVYTVDDGDHTVRKFTPEGKQLMMIGTPGKASDTGYDGSGLKSITRGGGPFNRPTGVSLSSNGDLYVCDGYGNARIHHFTSDGTHVRSWGSPGSGPGQFVLPHGICVTRDDRVLVADRENDRIQIFDLNGEYMEEWTHLQRPTGICAGRDGSIYVSNLWWQVGMESFRNGPIKYDLPGHISVLEPNGNLLLRWISADRTAPGNFVAPHCICVDSRGDIYVAEVTYADGVRRGKVPPDSHMFQKFARD